MDVNVYEPLAAVVAVTPVAPEGPRRVTVAPATGVPTLPRYTYPVSSVRQSAVAKVATREALPVVDSLVGLPDPGVTVVVLE